MMCLVVANVFKHCVVVQANFLQSNNYSSGVGYSLF